MKSFRNNIQIRQKNNRKAKRKKRKVSKKRKKKFSSQRQSENFKKTSLRKKYKMSKSIWKNSFNISNDEKI
jgi:hypothetical protein